MDKIFIHYDSGATEKVMGGEPTGDKLYNVWSPDHDSHVVVGGQDPEDAAARAIFRLRKYHSDHDSPAQVHTVMVRRLRPPAEICLVLSGYDSSDDLERLLGTYHVSKEEELLWDEYVSIVTVSP